MNGKKNGRTRIVFVELCSSLASRHSCGKKRS